MASTSNNQLDVCNHRQRIHGPAPDISGKNMTNLYGTLLSTALLLRHSLGLEIEAQDVEETVEALVSEGVRTTDTAAMRDSASTSAVGECVTRRILRTDPVTNERCFVPAC